uniref:Uncharacterized protein LOC116955994 n=1 Tax=Petromyzon marinus TaxID=7757 RepID=A0AAJ7XGG5_PETMA|nr:uncharacterized protein LOC116955994 [Petromyzon marinus]
MKTSGEAMLGTGTYAVRKRRRPSSKRPVPSPPDDSSNGSASKRHRQRLNAELERLAAALPLPRSLSCKLDKLSVLRLCVGFLRAKRHLQGGTTQQQQQQQQQLGALDGFLIAVASDGQIFYVSPNVQHYLGFPQTDLVQQSVYDLVHVEDREGVHRELSLAPSGTDAARLTGRLSLKRWRRGLAAPGGRGGRPAGGEVSVAGAELRVPLPLPPGVCRGVPEAAREGTSAGPARTDTAPQRAPPRLPQALPPAPQAPAAAPPHPRRRGNARGPLLVLARRRRRRRSGVGTRRPRDASQVTAAGVFVARRGIVVRKATARFTPLLVEGGLRQRGAPESHAGQGICVPNLLHAYTNKYSYILLLFFFRKVYPKVGFARFGDVTARERFSTHAHTLHSTTCHGTKESIWISRRGIATLGAGERVPRKRTP